VTAIALALVVIAQASGSLSPDQIFQRAQQAWQSRVVPPYEAFTVPCEKTFAASQCTAGDTIAFVVRMRDGRTFAQRVSPEGGSPVTVMRGGYITGPADTPLGFYRVITSTTGAPVASPPPNLAADPLQSIATVSASGHVYDIALAGEETIAGRVCYHLTLRPELNADRYPLRDVWVDTTSFEVVQLTYARPFEERHTHAIVVYRFAPVGPRQLWAIVYIEAQAGSDRVADDLSGITFPATAPDWYFQASNS
jgi:hypothetical protein